MTQEQEKAINRIRARCSIRGVIELGENELKVLRYSALHSAAFSQYPPDGTIQVGFESTATGQDRDAYIAPDGSRVGTRPTFN